MALWVVTTWISFHFAVKLMGRLWQCCNTKSQLWEGGKKRSILLKDQTFSCSFFISFTWTGLCVSCTSCKLLNPPQSPFTGYVHLYLKYFFTFLKAFILFSILINCYEIFSLISVVFQTLQAFLDTLDLSCHSHLSSLRSFRNKNTWFTSLKLSYGKVPLSKLVTLETLCRNRQIQRVMCLLLRQAVLLMSINF